MRVIDFHSHILPELDDGSKNVETSFAMYKESCNQGIEIIIATPHFYASKDRIDDFLIKRTKAYEKIARLPIENGPKILLGAEVAWFDGISKAEKVEKLSIEGTKLLLLELPFETWSRSMITELGVLTKKYHIVLAHLERYLKLPGNKAYIEELLRLPLTVQVNAGSLADWKQRRQILKMFKNGQAQVLGSDCHGMNHRPPNLMAGREVIRRKLGTEFLEKIDTAGNRLLEESRD